MKFFILLSLLSTQLWAVPVLNKNMAAEGTLVTIWPDHRDPDQFYFAPNFMQISLDLKKNAKFHLTEYYVGRCGRLGSSIGACKRKALLTTLFVAGFEENQLKTAELGIRKLRPQARFSAIPFLGSEVEFGETLGPFIDDHECAPKAGQAADEIPCSITLNNRGIEKLSAYLAQGKILPFKFLYKISGVIDDGSGHFSLTSLDYGLTVNLGGEMLINHPDLIEVQVN